MASAAAFNATMFACGRETDTLVIGYYPLGGNDMNTGPRYQVEARMTGFDVLGLTRHGTNTIRPNWTYRQELSPKRFASSLAVGADELAEIAARYEYVMVRGQSTGSFPALRLVSSKRVRITHLLIEDGINTRTRRNGTPKGFLGGELDWLRYGVAEARRMPRPPRQGWALPPTSSTSRLSAAAAFFVEQFHWARLWRSSYSRDVLLDIAANYAELPLLVCLVGHTGTTTVAEAIALQTELRRAAERRSRVLGASAADVECDLDFHAWHGFLLYPEYGVPHLLRCRAMRSLVR